MILRVCRLFGIVALVASSVLAQAAAHTKPIYLDKGTGRVVQTVLVIPFEYDLDHRTVSKIPSLKIEAEATDLLRRLHYDVTSLDFGSYFKGPYTNIESAIKSQGGFDSCLRRGSEFDVMFWMLFQLDAAPAFGLSPLVNDSEDMRLTAQASMFKVENGKTLKRVWRKTSEPVEGKIMIRADAGDPSGFHREKDAEAVVTNAVISAVSDVLGSLPDARLTQTDR